MHRHEEDRAGSATVVLVVDDAPDTLRLLCDMLETAGYTVLIARDGETALERLTLCAPDAILLDALMPGLSGFDTCRRIKDRPEWAPIPVIFMTGLSDTRHVLEGFACGGVDYVVKPVREAEVLARLRTHIGAAREVRLAHSAIDLAGLALVCVDERRGKVWCSARAVSVLGRLGLDPPSADEPGFWHDIALPDVGTAFGDAVTVRRLGATDRGETLLLISPRDARSRAADRLANAALTPRETEVLSWIAKGKTDRDIADILGISPRTVNKHLEHTFKKLGVETRAAAAALASQQMSL